MSGRLLITMVAVAVLFAAPAAWWLTRPPGTVGTVPPPASPTAVTSTSVTPLPQAAIPAPAAPPAVPRVEGGHRHVLAADPPPAPDRIRIPAIGVDAGVVPVGVAPNGEMEVPPSISQVAWYRHGPLPGDPGSAVLAAHVDFDGRPGAFRRLAELAPGDLVLVATGSSWAAFRVVGRTTYPKAELPTAELFRRTGEAVLTLVTCGGGFNPSLRSYDSNVVVLATPVTEAASGR